MILGRGDKWDFEMFKEGRKTLYWNAPNEMTFTYDLR